MEPNKKKIIFTIDDALHREIKVIAARRNLTMANWIVRQLRSGLIEETKYDREIDMQKMQEKI